MKRAAVFLCAAAFACSPSFDPPSRVTRLRVLAVRADAPYAAPGESVHLDTLAYDPAGRVLTWGWGACVDTPSLAVTDCIDAMDRSSFAISAAPTHDVVIPKDAIDTLPPQARARATVGVVAVACPGDLALLPGAPSIQSSGMLPFSCRDRDTGRELSIDEYDAGVKRIFVRATDRNANPAIARVLWDGADWPEAEVKDARPCATSDNSTKSCGDLHAIAAIPAPDAFESGVDSFGIAYREQVIVEYYAAEGIFEDDVRLADRPETKWVPRAAAAGRTITMWLVLRDDRGGVSWATRSVRVSAL